MALQTLIALCAALFLTASVLAAPVLTASVLAAPVLAAPSLAATEAAPATETAPATEAAPAIEVWKSPTCGCCGKWADYLEANGFEVTAKNTTRGMLERIKRQVGIGPKLASCHTALIDGYTVEGHVPAEDIKRLLAMRPEAIGLTVPDMPLGSPGMEQPDGTTEPYDVLLVKKDGSVEVFAKH